MKITKMTNMKVERTNLSANVCSSWLLLVALVPAAGCETFQPAKFNPPKGVGPDPVLVVPLSEPKAQRWYGESERGEYVAECLKSWVMTNSTPNFPEGPGADKVLDKIRDWRKDEIDIPDWKVLTASLGVRYVVYGEIEDLSLTRPASVGFLDAWVRTSYRVIDVQAERTVWWRKGFTVDLVKKRETDMPILESETNKAQAERKLLTRLAEQIGRDLYGYMDDSR